MAVAILFAGIKYDETAMQLVGLIILGIVMDTAFVALL